MIANGPFNRFRRPYQVIITTDSRIERGVIKNGFEQPAVANFSVQEVKNAQEIEALAVAGRRLSDWRRLYTDTRLPLIEEEVFIESGDLSTDKSALATEDGRTIRVGAVVGKSGLGNPALVVIDGHRYEVVHRVPMQNGIISHYKYYVVRKQF